MQNLLLKNAQNSLKNYKKVYKNSPKNNLNN